VHSQGHAIAAQVQAYVVFEVAGSSAVSTTADKLRSTSLGNCKQLVIGQHARDIFVHIACDEGNNTSYLNQALLRLSQVDGIGRVSVISLKHGTD
jgi:hypothetical protein